MKPTKHTPGPWEIISPNDDKGVFNIRKIGLQLVDSLTIDTPETEANARLIAAAPELLEALREVMFVLSVSKSPETHHRRNAEILAERAIVKATGGAE